MRSESGTRRFDTQEARRYWERHAEHRAEVDFEADPEGLANVCYVNAPQWLNRYHARLQRAVFEQLLDLVPTPSEEEHALEIGCGSGRWCRLLRQRGYSVTGIDLQESLIERNRQAMPEIDFVTTSIQEFDANRKHDLVASVTVLQHIPFAEQEAAIHKIGQLVRSEGWALILENARDHAPHVFPRSLHGWVEVFDAAGFQLVSAVPYDYGPATRLLEKALKATRRLLTTLRCRDRSGASSSVDAFNPGLGARGGFGGWLGRSVRRLTIVLDARLEPMLSAPRPRMQPTHVGLLFKKLPGAPA